MINPKLILRILHGSYDVVWIWGYSYLTCWLALIAAKLSGTHVLLRGEGVLSQPLSPFRKLLKKFIVGTYLKFVDGVAYSCEKNRQYYLSFGVSPQKLFFVPCAIDNKRFFNDAQNSDWQKVRHEFGFSENDFVILFVGKFAPVKRVKDLIQAIALTSNTDLKLLLVGTGYLRESLEALAMQDVPGQVKFAGFRNQSELPAFYSAADALAIASENDPSPKVVNEAMAMGLPVICSDRVGTVGDLVIHDQTGLVFPMGDIHQLAECIKQLASDREKANAIGQNAGLLIRDWSYEAGHKEIMHWIKNSVNDRQEAN
jgi:glycosyltransferase involved in cell wall biosynthesis